MKVIENQEWEKKCKDYITLRMKKARISSKLSEVKREIIDVFNSIDDKDKANSLSYNNCLVNIGDYSVKYYRRGYQDFLIIEYTPREIFEKEGKNEKV